MTHSSLRSLSFLHAFLFWGVLMNDLKSDLFLSLGCLGGTWHRRGRSLIGVGGSTREGFLSSVRTRAIASLFSSSHIKHGSYISFMRASAKRFFFFMKQNSFQPKGGKYGEYAGRRRYSALWWPCELENNIYRASHLTSFITKSRTPASPMKLGVNPSSASLSP